MFAPRIALTVGLLAVVALCAQAQEVTTIRVTNEVLVRDCKPFGINLGGDAYYSGAALMKKRSVANFEGTSYRQCHFGPIWDERGLSTWFGVPDYNRDLFIGSTYVILSGPQLWSTGEVKDIIEVPFTQGGRTSQQDMFVFDKPIQGPVNGGVMVENMRLDEGYVGRLDDYWRVNLEVNVGDVPPGSFGVAACKLKASDDPALIRFSTHYARYGALNGTWNVHFWSKAAAGSPSLRVTASPDEYGEGKDVEVGDDWRKHEVKLVVDKVPDPAVPGEETHHLLFAIVAKGGDVLIDDVEIWMDGDENPTAFRDDVVNMLKKYKPGCLRFLQMGGNTLRNTLMPPLRTHAYTSRKTHRAGPYESKNNTPYGLHQFYELCKHIGTEPWYCLPGTLRKEEIGQFMEYLGGDETTEFGKLRIEMGQREPWTDVFTNIHVEFGNEAWNNAAAYQLGGFNGPDYWRSLVETGKASEYYRTNVIFHAAGQAASTSRNESIMARVPNADRFSVAPYILHSFSKEEAARQDTDDKFFRWAYAWAIRRSMSEDGSMFQNYELAKSAGIELSIYEVNHHITGGDGPLEPRNKLTTSIGGGLNVANNMLTMLKEHHIRTQALFSLVQHAYNASGVGPVRLWGTALTMRAGRERYRPTFLACATANGVMHGDLVKTVHEGTRPTFDSTAEFSRRNGVETMSDVPVLWSYAFSDGKTRALVVVNLDTNKAREVAVAFEGAADGPATSWLLAADSITANNEFEQPEPQVKVQENEVADFASGHRLTLPAHSMIALKWKVQ